MIGEKLQRHDVENRREAAVVFGQTNDVHALLGLDLRIAVGKDVKFPAARTHFLHVALELFKQFVVGRHRHDGHFLVDERERPVLEFARGIGFRVDVTDFLELERALKRDRIVHAAPEEESVGLGGEMFRPSHHLRFEGEHRAERRRDVAQTLQFLILRLGVEATVHLGERKGEQIERRQLRREGLGRGDAHFHARARHVGEFALGDHHGGGHVADGEGLLHAEFVAGVPQSGERVRGLARLRNRDDERVGIGH